MSNAEKLRTFEGVCLAGTPGCEGAEYLHADRVLYERVRVFYREDGTVWAEQDVDPDDLGMPEIEEEETLDDLRCGECGVTITSGTELHKIAKHHAHYEKMAEERLKENT